MTEKEEDELWEKIVKLRSFLESILEEEEDIDVMKVAEDLVTRKDLDPYLKELVKRVLEDADLEDWQIQIVKDFMDKYKPVKIEGRKTKQLDLELKTAKSKEESIEDYVDKDRILSEDEILEIIKNARKEREKLQSRPITIESSTGTTVSLDDRIKEANRIARELYQSGWTVDEIKEHIPDILIYIWVHKDRSLYDHFLKLRAIAKKIAKETNINEEKALYEAKGVILSTKDDIPRIKLNTRDGFLWSRVNERIKLIKRRKPA